MPTYEYRCQQCGHEFEEFQSITAKPLRKCPKCAKPKLKRLIGTGAGIIFKGGGFWQTDYRSENYKAGAKADAEASKPAETKSDSGKSEAPAAKSESATSKSDTPATKSEAPATKKADTSRPPSKSAKKGK